MPGLLGLASATETPERYSGAFHELAYRDLQRDTNSDHNDRCRQWMHRERHGQRDEENQRKSHQDFDSELLLDRTAEVESVLSDLALGPSINNPWQHEEWEERRP